LLNTNDTTGDIVINNQLTNVILSWGADDTYSFSSIGMIVYENLNLTLPAPSTTPAEPIPSSLYTVSNSSWNISYGWDPTGTWLYIRITGSAKGWLGIGFIDMTGNTNNMDLYTFSMNGANVILLD